LRTGYLKIEKDDFHGEWNYIIRPRPKHERDSGR